MRPGAVFPGCIHHRFSVSAQRRKNWGSNTCTGTEKDAGEGGPSRRVGLKIAPSYFFLSKSCILVRSTYSDATVNKLLYDVCYMCVSYSLPILYGSCVIYLYYFLFVYT